MPKKIEKNNPLDNIAGWEWLNIHSLIEQKIAFYHTLADGHSDFKVGVKEIQLQRWNDLKGRVEEIIKVKPHGLRKPA